ncbi:MAG: amidohydrolase family protein, partial [Acetobacterales bacterium]
MSRTAFVNARLLDPDSGLDATGGLLIEDGRIVDVGAGLFAGGAPESAQVVDCGGACLAPGLVDLRVHIREPGEEHKETTETASAAAAAGGVTTIMCMPDTDPPIDDPALVEYVARQARESSDVRLLPCAAVTRGLKGQDLAELYLLAEAGAVAFSDADHCIADAQMLRRALSYAADLGLPLSHHLEDPTLAAAGAMNEGAMATRIGLAGIPTEAETIIVERDMRLVALSGGRWHSSPLSTGAALDCVRRAKARGLQVTAETAPPYFDLNETAVGDYRTFAKLSPPL